MAGGSGHVIISSYSSDNGLLITTHHLSQTFFCGRVLLNEHFKYNCLSCTYFLIWYSLNAMQYEASIPIKHHICDQ